MSAAPTKHGDRVMTPPWAAEDMMSYFRPVGKVLDPCRGEGAFTDALSACGLLPLIDLSWCEIEEGVDFFAWTDPVDWVVGNPPYSMTREWFRHSYRIADNLLYLVPLRNVFSGFGFVREIYDFGGIVQIRVYGTGGKLGFPMGNAVGAFHIRRDYRGPLRFTFYEDGLWGGGPDRCIIHQAVRAIEEDPRVCWEYDGEADCRFTTTEEEL